ncbi:uncharacterized protein K489DRAFT_382861 [Dissoconium aciculare CBS 342.82]|uniref:Uncharacterized protein n=1 Tax=Dissoconium aciculare CBS 342.82 TaxID=1314786 RepID=A0A6J3LWF8_9PEZI|nr:uncharacterized protein K489DRAFT_382861 [Dissoconium aciculare CBS 342.82]KAF1820105.1 hypothetical protein K489DRAFT_382861 [Dissoconium aciculare CBS 342.82]
MFGSQSLKFLTHLTGGIPSGSHYDTFPWVPSDQPTAKSFSVSHHRHPKENPIHSRPLAPNSSRISPSRPSSSSSRGPNDGEKKVGKQFTIAGHRSSVTSNAYRVEEKKSPVAHMHLRSLAFLYHDRQPSFVHVCLLQCASTTLPSAFHAVVVAVCPTICPCGKKEGNKPHGRRKHPLEMHA